LLDELLRSDARYASGFDKSDLRRAPAKRLAVLTCMDAGIDGLRR
jgi:carbonic anhydrase